MARYNFAGLSGVPDSLWQQLFGDRDGSGDGKQKKDYKVGQLPVIWK